MSKSGNNRNPQNRSNAQRNHTGNTAGRNYNYGRNSGKIRNFYAYEGAYYGDSYRAAGQYPVGRAGGKTSSKKHRSAAKSSGRSVRQSRVNARASSAVQEMNRDYSFIFIVLFFLVFGLVMLYSTSSYEAGIEFGDSAHYLKRQLAATVVGLAVMMAVSRIPLRFWKRYNGALYIFSLMMLVLIIPFGRTVNGAKRWIYIGPVSVQPAEISKIAVIITTAVLLSRSSRNFLQSWRKSFMILVPAVIQVAMIYGITRNMSSAIIVAAIALCMMFVATEDYKRYWLLFLIVGAAAVIWIYLAMQDGSGGSFRSGRIRYWLDPQAYAESGAMQTLQGLYGIGSGGIFGKGLGQSMQKLGYIPEAQNDMIFSIICEELGLFGAVSIIAMFIILCWRMMVVAMRARDLFSSLVVVGVMSQIAVQVVLNIAVVTNTIPNTGVTLPFFSYGGSAIVIQLAEIGLVLNVARNSSE